jgi:hypothetical protein
MNITPNEIHSIEDAGMLDNSPVRLIRTKGGFWVAVGKPKGKHREEAIAAGSHPAIVKFDLEKRFPNFQASMMKSEYYSDTSVVEKHSHFLNEELRNSGHDIYSIQDGSDIDFHITKHNSKIASVNGTLEEEFLLIKDLNVPKEFSKGLAGATVEKAISCKAGLKFKSK